MNVRGDDLHEMGVLPKFSEGSGFNSMDALPAIAEETANFVKRSAT